MAQAIQGARNVFVTPQATTINNVWGSQWSILIPLGLVLGILFIGVKYFKREAKNFAENL